MNWYLQNINFILFSLKFQVDYNYWIFTCTKPCWVDYIKYKSIAPEDWLLREGGKWEFIRSLRIYAFKVFVTIERMKVYVPLPKYPTRRLLSERTDRGFEFYNLIVDARMLFIWRENLVDRVRFLIRGELWESFARGRLLGF